MAIAIPAILVSPPLDTGSKAHSGHSLQGDQLQLQLRI